MARAAQAEADAATMTDMMQQDGVNGPLEKWDWRYYAEKRRKDEEKAQKQPDKQSSVHAASAFNQKVKMATPRVAIDGGSDGGSQAESRARSGRSRRRRHTILPQDRSDDGASERRSIGQGSDRRSSGRGSEHRRDGGSMADSVVGGSRGVIIGSPSVEFPTRGRRVRNGAECAAGPPRQRCERSGAGGRRAPAGRGAEAAGTRRRTRP